ncbi:peptidoglycan recognition protein family protein [Pedobacter panaciterrae]|uniref:N-acetylmuramoyl-L-alanine amidase n=1 Tax=Pedobacter panaciterrae TaxID=363849 RepID=UPI002598557A|nr:peptidoglycan recognition family protein [uncultured Pedobacter sp.]
MPNWKPIVGLSFSSEEFDTYCHALQWNAWRPSFIVLHNTAVPTLANRPNGLNKNNIDNLVKYYRDDRRWSAGPHLFIDDHKIWVFTPLTMSGIHSPTWNKIALGVEMLGNYATEDFNKGRGAAVRENAVAAMATLCAVLGINPNTMKLHKEDPKTTHKCPGAKVSKVDVINEVEQLLLLRHGNEHSMMEQ